MGAVLAGARHGFAAASSPASGPATRIASTRGTAERIDLPGGGFYWLARPPGYKPGDRPPLVICLHGTDDTAADALAFWRACGPKGGALLAAPQAGGRGWADTDVPRLRETWADLQKRASFDPRRILLAGFSAGGAMAFHWLYREKFPATAVVTLANYMPPGVTAEHVGPQKHVPVFYGVGVEDINHERMRLGLAMLREQGVRVTLVRPPIGHMLSPAIGREAVAWFEDLCREAARRRLDEAAEAMHRDAPAGNGRAAVEAERLLSQARWHDPGNVKRAEMILVQALEWGRARMAEADALAANRQGDSQRGVDAVACLRELERVYAGASIAQDARAKREALEADPAVRAALAERDRRRREQDATAVLLDVQRHIAAGRFDEARRGCEQIITAFGDTPAAERARGLLPKIPKGGSP